MRPSTRTTLLALSILAASSAFAAEQTVTGAFKGNGKDAKLAYVVARKAEPFSGKEVTQVIFTEKDPGAEAKPEMKALFGEYGSALVLKIDSEGSIIGCEVAHAAHAQKPFSSLGKIKTENYKLDQGVIQAKITTGGEIDAFDQKWLVDLNFKAKINP